MKKEEINKEIITIMADNNVFSFENRIKIINTFNVDCHAFINARYKQKIILQSQNMIGCFALNQLCNAYFVDGNKNYNENDFSFYLFVIYIIDRKFKTYIDKIKECLSSNNPADKKYKKYYKSLIKDFLLKILINEDILI